MYGCGICIHASISRPPVLLRQLRAVRPRFPRRTRQSQIRQGRYCP